MSTITKMISSLPNLHKADVDVNQAKLAIAILREISASICVPERKQFNQITGISSRYFRSISNKDLGTSFSTAIDEDSTGSAYTTAEGSFDNSEDDNESHKIVNLGEKDKCGEKYYVEDSSAVGGSDKDKMITTMNDNFHTPLNSEIKRSPFTDEGDNTVSVYNIKEYLTTTTTTTTNKGKVECISGNESSPRRRFYNNSNSNSDKERDNESQSSNGSGRTNLQSLDLDSQGKDNLLEINSQEKLKLEHQVEEKLGLRLLEDEEHEEEKNGTINVGRLQRIFDAFKVNELELPIPKCKALLNLLGKYQIRDDFQWALHQLGGFHALIFLYARIVEICPNEEAHSKGLFLVLAQIKHERKLTDSPIEKQRQYHLIRFVLNSERSIFGFQTFLTLINACLSASGNEIKDYQLLNICLVSSWKNLVRNRCREEDSPNGERSLFEIFLTIVLDLCLEKNSFRDFNIGLLKVNGFSERLLSICNCKMTNQEHKQANLSVDDALRIGSLVKSIFLELMAPPDAYVAVTLVKFGLVPLLPKELPPLPLKNDSFFIYNYQEEQDVQENVNSNADTELSDLTNTTSKHNIKKFDNNNMNIQNTKFSGRSQREEFSEAFHSTLLEGIMSILLNTLSLLPDGSFHSTLRPNLSSHILVAYCSHPNPTLKKLALKLLSGYLSRVKNPDLTDFIRNKGFALTSLYIQSCPDISRVALNICKGFGPASYSLIVGLIYSNTVVKTLIEWIHQDEATVATALLSVGLLPSILNLHTPNQTMSKSLSQLLSLVTKFMVLNPKDGPWKILFCPGIESAPQSSIIIANMIQYSIGILRHYSGNELKKSDASERLLWLLERSSGSLFGPTFEKWLLNIFASHIMEIEESEETETWKYFVRKNRKRLQYLFGAFICKILAPDQGDIEFKQYTIRFLYMSCQNLETWLPKIIRRDDQVERCFTAFLRVFFAETDHRQTVKLDSKFKSASFQSLVSSTDGNLVLTLHAAAAVGLPSGGHVRKHSVGTDTICDSEIHLSDATIRSRFENMLLETGLLSPSNNFSSSTYSSDFKNFKILIEAPPISGVSYHELRQCLVSAEKMRTSVLSKSTIYTNTLKFQNATYNIQISNSPTYFNTVFDTVNNFAEEVLGILTRMRTRQEIEIAKCICRRENDIVARQKWWKIREQMGHPKASWHFQTIYPISFDLDQSEGPGRIRMRLRRVPLKIENKFIKSECRRSDISEQPLEYLFSSDSIEFMGYPGIQSEIKLIRSCLRIVPGEESPGEIVVSTTSLHFISEVCLRSCWNRVDIEMSKIHHILRRRYNLKHVAVEIFLDSRSYFFVFRTFQDREALIHQLQPRSSSFPSTQSISSATNVIHSINTMTPSQSTMTSQWVKGKVSNFEYLMYLNTAAGRSYCDLMQYPVFPFVLCNYDDSTLDLSSNSSYRNLTRPMAIQDPTREDHFISTYNYLKREGDSTPFHYGSHYSNSGIVLHFLVRLPPYTQHFLKYQDGNFDIPDRSFHSVETMWRLASKESNTDFKEAIPEFYYLPEFLKNLQHFDMGFRQNGTRVDDVKLPPWAKGDARLFTLINRQALESNQVRNYLSDWIDLIFGHKQTGKAAVQAVNVFHPSTYEGFEINGGGADEVLRRARKAMIATYGQTPYKLFAFPHPRPQSFSIEENSKKNVLDGINGIRWGHFVGSPASLCLDVVNTREFHEPVTLFQTESRVVFWPNQTVIMGDSVVGSWDASGVRIKSNIIYLCIGDEITTCDGTHNNLWIGHRSGRISVLKLSTAMDKVLETIGLFGHYEPIKRIDLNQEFSTAISCSGENYVILWDTNRNSFINIIEEPESIDFAYSSRSTGDIVLLNREKNQIKFKTINGFDIGTITPEEKIESVCISGLDPGRNVNLIAVGSDYGNIKFYSTWDLKFITQIKVVHLSILAIQSIRYSSDGRRLYCIGQSGKDFITAALQLLPGTN